MEIKNLKESFSSGRAKILTAFLGCMAIAGTIIVLSDVAIGKDFLANVDGSNYYSMMVEKYVACNANDTGKYVCSSTSDGARYKCYKRWSDARLDGGCKCFSDPTSCCLVKQAESIADAATRCGAMASAVPAATGTETTIGEAKKLTFQNNNVGATCVYNASSPRGASGECKGDTYCFSMSTNLTPTSGTAPGKCELGCAMWDNSGNIIDWYKLGQTTCKNSGAKLAQSALGTLLPDGVYECKKISSSSDDDGVLTRVWNGAVWNEERKSSMMIDHYGFSFKNNCLSCEEAPKGSAYCRNNTDNSKCEDIKLKIRNQFSNYVADTNQCRNSGKEGFSTWEDYYYNCYRGSDGNGGVRGKYVKAFEKNGDLSGAGGIIRVFERLAYPGGWRYGGKVMIETQGTLNFPSQTQVIGDSDILCEFNTTDANRHLINEECNVALTGMNNYFCTETASNPMSNPFKGNSGGRQYQCARVNIGDGISCGMYGWVQNQSYVSCNSGRVERFGIGDYFRKDSSGKPLYGWGKGSDENGCEYVSFATAFGSPAAGNDDKAASSYSYYETRMLTGYCYGQSRANVEGTAVCKATAGLVGTETKTQGAAKIISYEIEQIDEKQIQHTVKTSGASGCTIAAGACQIGTSVKSKIEKYLSLIAANQQTGEKTFRLSDNISDWLVVEKEPAQISCTVTCDDQSKTETLIFTESFSNEQPNYCLHNRKWYSVGAYICDGNISKMCAKDQKRSDQISYAGWVDEKCATICDQNTGKCASQDISCYSNSRGRSFVSSESICGKCGYQESSVLKEGVCRCDEKGNWVLQDECLKADCSDQQDRDKKFTAQCVKKSEAIDCSKTPKGCLVAANDCGDCGTGWVCKNREEIAQTQATDYSTLGGDGICVKSEGESQEPKAGEAGECTFSINPGTPSSSNSRCKQGSMFGIYVPFTLKTQGDCSGISCWVTNDYDGGKSPAASQGNVTSTTTTSNWSACAFPKSNYGGSSAQTGSSGKGADRINFKIECGHGNKSAGASTSCPFPSADDNAFCDDKTKDEEQKEEEQKRKEEDGKAPQVNISSPSGTINTKTAQLSVTTDIAANCKYMLNQEGGLSAGNFDGAGMVLSGAGSTNHTATLSNLTNIQATNCKYNHSVIVFCKNSKASAGAVSAIGSAQTSFSVDLSQDSSNAPVVVAVMDPKHTIANPVLRVTTDRSADCEYKKDGDFAFGGGTKFDTTGSYAHNAQLNDLASGDHAYYVVCQDKTTCAANKPGLSVKFKVDLSEDPSSAPKIVSTTPEIQTIANPTLSVTTDRPAACQYKKDSTFAYDGGTQFINDGEYAHSVSLAELPDGKHTFYVACKDKATGAKKTLETAIVTTLNRGGAAGAPVISNTTPPSQNTNNPTLSVITDRAAICQYQKSSDFIYGQGTQFTIDGGTGHSAVLSSIPDGTHTYYVVCQDPTTQISNVPGAQIIFSVNTAADVCASLSSNDKQSDGDRNYSGDADYNSIYIWRSVASGTVESFEKVNWHAGYQFTPEKDGTVTELCGYFDSGNRRRVSLYDGGYKELAGTEIDGQGGWSCANIPPIKVKADRRYYAIARVQDDSIYFAYKSGLLPRRAQNVVIESGVRQLGSSGKFGEELKKYDYILFGLVDVKIKFTEESARGPRVLSPLPDGNRERSDLVLSLATDQDATCKFDREDLEYKNMRYTFGATGQKLHQQKVCNLSDGPFTWYARCKDNNDTNDASTLIQFKVDD